MSCNESSNSMSYEEIDAFIKSLKRTFIKELGTDSWWALQVRQQQLSQQALMEVEQSSTENVKRSLIENNKIAVLVHEAICISVWREKVFPQLTYLAEAEPTKNFMIYMVLYHETTAISLLEAVLYHQDACQQLGDYVVDLIDYCAAAITSLFTRGNKVAEPTDIASKIKNQEESLTFGVGIRCIAIIQYLAEHMESVHLSAITRLYQTHDFPMLISHLLEASPWTKACETGKTMKYSDGLWLEVEDGCAIGRPEAHSWLAIHQLLLYPELGKYYHMTEFARSHFMKLESKISEWLLGQLPPLHQLKQGLFNLSQFQLPVQRQSVILEIIPEIRNSLLLEQTQSWEEIVELHKKLLIQCPQSHAANVASRLCKTLCAASTAGNVCTFCSRPAKSRCSRCKESWYCGRQCQVSHFPHHKKTCNLPSKS